MARNTKKHNEKAQTRPSVYDMLRNKAKDMNHAAADLPDELWNKYAKQVYKRDLLNDSKLMITDYMMGRLSPVDLAEAMAEDNALRYVVSDICRMRLEPAEINIQRNDKYIDLAAGAKTFWSEMKVPLPSEVDAARDLRNIYFGIEAGRASVGAKQTEEMVSEEEKPKSRSIRDRIRNAKQKAAEKGIELLSSVAEENKPESQPEKSEPTELEQLVSMGVDPKQAYQSLQTKQCANEIENMTMAIEASQDTHLKKSERIEALKAAGLPEERAKSLIQNGSVKNEARAKFSSDDLNQPVDDRMSEILDQIQLHASRDLKTYQKQEPTKQQEVVQADEIKSAEEKRTRKGYVNGEFEGKQVHFKGSWSGHTFSNEEIDKLLAGESISFTYTNRDGEDKDVSGKLEYQTHNNHKYLGFKANFGRKAIEKPKQTDSARFNEQDEMQAAGMSSEDLEGLFDISDPIVDEASHKQTQESSAVDETLVELTEEDVSAISGDIVMPFAQN